MDGFGPLANQGFQPSLGQGFTPFFGQSPLGQTAGMLLTQQLGSAGYLAPQFSPIMSVYDLQRNQQMEAQRRDAMAQAAKADHAQLMQTARGLHTLAGAPFGPEQQKNTSAALDTLTRITPIMADVAPDLVDSLHGTRGSSAVMASNVSRGLRYHRANGVNAGEFSRDLFNRLYGADAPGDMSGLGAGRTGQMFDEMTRRGMMSDGSPMKDRASEVERSAGRLKEMAKAVSAVRDLFGANGKPNAPMKELMDGLEQLTQGSAHWMNGKDMEGAVRRIHGLSRNIAGGLDRFLQLGRQGGALAEHAGLDRSFGMQTAQSSMAFGEAFGQVAGRQGFGGLSKDEATILDQQLRTSAAASPMAKALGGLMAMADQGLIKGGKAAELVSAIRSRDPAAMAQLANLTPGQIRNIVMQSGVSGQTASTFFQGDNQAEISQHGITDIVRHMQGQGEVGNFIRAAMGGSMAGGFARAGFSREEQRQLVPRAAEAAKQALMQMDGDLISNPQRATERNAKIAAAIRAAVGDDAYSRLAPMMPEIVATAVKALEGAMKRNPGLRQHKNLAGLIGMHRGDVLDAGDAKVHQADAEAKVASQLGGVGGGDAVARTIDAIAGADDKTTIKDILSRGLGGIDARQVNLPAALDQPVKRAALAAGRGEGEVSSGSRGGPTRFSFGTLVIRQDGSAEINAGDNTAGSAPTP